MRENFPKKFVRIISESHGANGAKWLDELPAIIWEIEEAWSLAVGAPYENLSYHFVAPCVLADGGKAVVKIGFPEENSPIFNEAEMLKLYAGTGAIRFLQIDEKRLALLLEKAHPGGNLKEIFRGKEEQTVEIAAGVLQKIIRKSPPKHSFIFLEEWFAGFEKAQNTVFPAAPVEKARKFYEELSAHESFLIHGDFHHENILSAAREKFLVIDPKGVIGQIGYEISVFLNNHLWILWNDENLREKLSDAVLKFSEAFEIEPRILRKWAYAQGVLSAWWTFEENSEKWIPSLATVEAWEV